MPQHVRMDVPVEPLPDRPRREPALDRARARAACRCAPTNSAGSSAPASARALCEPRAQRLARRRADGHDAFLRALAHHAHFARRQGRGDRSRGRRARTGAGPTNRRARTARGRARASGSSPSIVDQLHGFVGRERRREGVAATSAPSVPRTGSRAASGRARAGIGRTRATPRACARGCAPTGRAPCKRREDARASSARVSARVDVARRARRALRTSRRYALRVCARRACARCVSNAARCAAFAARRRARASSERRRLASDVYERGRKRAVATLASSASRVR